MNTLTRSASRPLRTPSRMATGRIISGLVIAFLLLDGVMKLVAPSVVTDTMAALGWPSDAGTARMLGILTLGATLLYALRKTELLGAILLTAYLGGAVATHVRIGSPVFTHILFGVYLGVALWLGLWLRRPALRALIQGGE